jgi:CHAT domain-containing protein/Tfp pilus assembly protein PilF
MASGSTLDEANKAVARGDYTTAIALWNRLLAGVEDPNRIELLIRRGETYRALGHYQDAQQDFQVAWLAAQKAAKPILEVIATQALGRIYFLQRKFTEAEQLLRASLEQARQLELSVLAAASANTLGSIQHEQGQKAKAKISYAQALAMAQQAGDDGLVAVVHRNLAWLAGNDARIMEELREARTAAENVETPHERAELLLGIAVEARDSVSPAAGQEFAAEALRQVATIAEEIDAPRLKSLAAGHLGQLHEKQGHLTEALAFTEKATGAAQLLLAHELLLEWEWQRGRLLRIEGDRTRAIEAFRRAAYHLEAIRQDIPITYHGGRSSFRETWAPIYLDLVDMLLQQAATESDAKREQSLLREARDYVERIKVSELRDYLRDPCIAAKTEDVEGLSPTTAIFYPIVLPNRLELLLSIGRQLYLSTSAVTSEQLADMVMLLSYRLRNQLSFQSEARIVYTWLIKPVIPLLEEHTVDTLVFVPDGPLRLLPIAALKVGQQYLAERYAIATVPGLTLLDPHPLPRIQMRSLLAGLSRPGPVVDKLSPAFLYSVMRTPTRNIDRSRRGLPVTVADLWTSMLSSFEFSEQEVRTAEVMEKLTLPGVKKEIDQLSQLLEGEVLLDDDFRYKRFVSEVRKHSYRIVHIASHGFFGNKVEDNYILTYDDKLDMNRLANLLRSKQLAERPLELLVLSACQTAEGNDRTPLGLSGVALKSGARSALGSLWPVYDEAAQHLLPAFYTQFSKPGVTKAQALQKAQLELLGREEFSHPSYWAAFILVGNWL